MFQAFEILKVYHVIPWAINGSNTTEGTWLFSPSLLHYSDKLFI
jgi:hypothetical protein